MKLVWTSSDDFIKHIKKYIFQSSLEYFKKDESFKYKIFQSENCM